MTTVDLHPEAVEEARAARQWYAERSLAAAAAFDVELDRAIEAIADGPSRWMRYIADTRRFIMQRFPYSLVYFEMPNGVLVLAVAHAKRRPGYWRGRLSGNA